MTDQQDTTAEGPRPRDPFEVRRRLADPFARVPERLADDRDVTDRALRVWIILDRYTGRGGFAWPSRRTLAARLACSVDTVDRALANLEACGWLEVERRPHRSSVYTLVEPVEGWGVAADLRPGSRTVAAPGGRTVAALNENDLNESQVTTSPAPASPVAAVFAAWLEATGRTSRTALDEKRRRLILRALDRYPLTDVIDAVRGWRHSPYHTGNNPTGQVYNDLGLLLRDADHIERFRDLERQPPSPIAQGAAAQAQADLLRRIGEADAAEAAGRIAPVGLVPAFGPALEGAVSVEGPAEPPLPLAEAEAWGGSAHG